MYGQSISGLKTEPIIAVNARYYIRYKVEVEIEVNDKNEWNNGYWYGYGFEDVIEHATILFKKLCS